LLKTQAGTKTRREDTDAGPVEDHTPRVLHGCEKKRFAEKGICKSLKTLGRQTRGTDRSVVVHRVVVLKKLSSSNKKKGKGESAVRSEGLPRGKKLAASKIDLHDLRGEAPRSVIYKQLDVGPVEVQMAKFSCDGGFLDFSPGRQQV
jgi:hypothetical protein